MNPHEARRLNEQDGQSRKLKATLLRDDLDSGWLGIGEHG